MICESIKYYSTDSRAEPLLIIIVPLQTQTTASNLKHELVFGLAVHIEKKISTKIFTCHSNKKGNGSSF